MKKKFTLALAGNPNCGKTTIFNNLTGARQKVGNWPGVTVEKKEGILKHKDYELKIVDLPGTYSLTPFSIEEITARDFIINETPDIVVNIIDASNLERSLFLAIQILELGRPAIFVLNMADVAQAKGIKIDEKKLSQLLGLPVVFTVGNKNKGIENLVEAAVQEIHQFESGKKSRDIRYSLEIENCIVKIESCITESQIQIDGMPRWNAIKILEDDKIVKQKLMDQNSQIAQHVFQEAKLCRERIHTLFEDDFEIVLTDDRYGVIAGIIKEIVSNLARKRIDMSRNIDLVLTDRFFGIPVFVFFIWAMFQLTFSLGEYPMGWIESGVSFLSTSLDNILPASLLKDLLLDGVIAGIGSVVIFLPNILILFFCIALFEDTGYMARTAFLMDRVMHASGLHGKSFIPMLMGFGCNVPAIMATRTLESPQDRILTILMTPFMSCSARLPVYIVLAGSFFGNQAGTVIFSLYLTGIIVAILSGRLLRNLLFKGAEAPFIMELPPYRMPMLKSLLIHMWDRSKMFLKKMGGVILAGSVIIWCLSSFPRNISYSQDYSLKMASVKSDYELKIAGTDQKTAQKLNTELALILGDIENKKEQERVSKSYIGRIGKFLEPVFSPVGIGWRAGVALVTGLVAKEVVVSTMGVLYGVGNSGGQALERALKKSGMTKLSALSMMVFVLLYMPCFATIAMIYKETSAKWAGFSLIYTTSVAWGGAFLVYQTGKIFGLG
ncbi:MAG: ferrous iron transport protein B [Proteobacteria bacterium]|nr:ferrous iron transport protein B [Pseudomonadota bacterium]MBU1386410.1 ferrous iron transport protein B [Pseudomonadota bacterium]MBU1544521.1 ferrous iron transport protein B [Pseudomonadota bacterium]MBU2429396.1 ferrous iron transport protein B [Pseudomonadota bacterium]MBU2480115.1 ferrous iron transport protein B [Pseudomonadota bacterium]